MQEEQLFIILIFITLYCLLIAILAILPIVAMMVFKLLHKDFAVKVSKCVLWWIIWPILLPSKAKELGVISKSVYGWILALLSPIAILIYILVAFFLNINKPLPYDELLFTSHEDIVAITEIADFPEFEYVTNTREDFGDVNYTENRFKNEEDAEKLFLEIESKLMDKENIFWSKDSLWANEDKERFGSDIVYVCERGWDTLYTNAPKGIKEERQVQIVVGKKIFTLKDEVCIYSDLDYYSNADSLSKLTGVQFPKYKIVNLNSSFNGFHDPSLRATLILDKKPSWAFIQSIKKAEHWEKQDDGTYKFHMLDSSWRGITIDPKSRIVELSVSTY